MECSDILKYGVFDVRETYSNTEIIKKYFRWLEKNKLTTEEKTRHYLSSAGLDIPELGIDVHGEGDYGDSHRSYFSEAFLDVINSNDKYSKEFYEKNTQASSVLVNAWQNCMRFKEARLFGQATYSESGISTTSDYDDISIYIKVNFMRPAEPDELYLDFNEISNQLAKLGNFTLIEDLGKYHLKDDVTFTLRRNQTSKTKDMPLNIRMYDNADIVNSYYHCTIFLKGITIDSLPANNGFTTRNPQESVVTDYGSNEKQLVLNNLIDQNVYIDIEANFTLVSEGGGSCTIHLFEMDSENPEVIKTVLDKAPVTNISGHTYRQLIAMKLAYKRKSKRIFKGAVYSWDRLTETKVYLKVSY